MWRRASGSPLPRPQPRRRRARRRWHHASRSKRGPVTAPACFARRRAGILLHISSLPGEGPVGGLGAPARRFVDFLAGAGQSVWQTLPLGPTHDDGSPYQCLSVHAGNPGFIDRDALHEEGWLDGAPSGMSLAAAWQAFQARADTAARYDFEAFCAEHKSWLDDYALYCAIREEQGHQAWWHWPAPLRDR
ncbi:MAG TPA: hypothetical protein ENJ19_02385, partial [Gammaproteobacteria bacterium]|nr:hypothetical protein [Gammaproteobacteria bacterium]